MKSVIGWLGQTNDLLKQKMTHKWGLKPIRASPWRSSPLSSAAPDKEKPKWWPSRDVLDKLEGYGFIHGLDELDHNL